jgi:2-C-methyl-D-erythritol 4-phosphate cytidylyltransferase/2-C-methyl-D-erythritol 2,4-cyclodiphosphate synthase
MGGSDKLEATIAGRPVLRWSVEAFAAAPSVARVIVVTAAERVAALSEAPWLRSLGATVLAGGARRQDSVAVGVAAATAAIVLVHDAARPLVSGDVIERVARAAADHGGAIPALPVVDALKQVDDAGVIVGTAERSGLYRAQTPQGARRELIQAAAAAHAAGPEELKDEAELLARAGASVVTVPGDSRNIKVTLPEDLALARQLAGEGPRQRITHGGDSHPFGTELGLRIGGLTMETAPRLHGHSDGDVVLHALCDALLAASGGGDLGRHFPSGERATRGIDSRELVGAVMAEVRAAGLRVAGVDLTVLGARPRLGAERLDAMAGIIAGLVDVEPAHVSVKAATGNLSGDEGAGRVISASCLVSVVSP